MATTDIVAQISQNLGNMNNILLHALKTECPDVIQNYQSILSLNHFCHRTQNTYSPLLLMLSEKISQWKHQSIFGDYLIELFECGDCLTVADAELQIAIATQYFESKHPLEKGKEHFVYSYRCSN
jgi:hypothetical protein